MEALLDASASTRGLTYAGLALLAVGGFVDASLGHWWSARWLRLSIVLFVLMAIALVALAIPFYRRLRAAVKAGEAEQIERLSASPVPFAILAVGVIDLAVILWLMVYKPF